MRKWWLVPLAAALLAAASRTPDVPFQVHMIDGGASEVAAIVDVNRDGKLDILAAENWYEAPAWKAHKFRNINFTNNYVDAFANLPLDVDGDGYPDVVTSSWFDRKISWWRNPGKGTGMWVEAPIDSGFPNEFSFLVDLNNDGKAEEVVTQSGNFNQPQAWYEVKAGKWVKHIVSSKTYGHGIGVGDVNGDKRNDIVTPLGWLEAPADPAASNWKYHPDWDDMLPAQGNAAPVKIQMGYMQVVDVNGDGRNDIIAGNGHDYGVMWMEQGEGGKWTKRMIDTTWSHAHASALADINGDGKLDFIAGKRYFAHNGNDPGEREPLGLYWYDYRKNDRGVVEWTRHIIDYGSRVGGGVAALPVADIDGDGDLDIISAGKSGLFLLENLTKTSLKK